VSAALPLRVTVLDSWDAVPLEVPPGTTPAELKRMALARMGIRRPAEGYVVKYNGAELFDEHRSLADLGIPPHAALIVLQRRRMAVR
jgi:hypothetical protein